MTEVVRVKGRRYGAVQRAFRWLMGAKTRPPKASKFGSTGTPTQSENYEGMDPNYRWFRQDEVTRRCLVVNAIFATMSGSYTDVEVDGESDGTKNPNETYRDLKEKIDEYNRRVNLDQAVYIAQIKRAIYGHTGFEIVKRLDDTPEWLLSLQSGKLKPNQTNEWELLGFDYEGRKNMYALEELLYFTNLQTENDYYGLSDIEPIRDVCQARHELLRENFAEIVRTIWAPYVILTADTTMMTAAEEDAFLIELAELARSGKNIALNQSIEATVVKNNVDIVGLNVMLEKFEQSIIAQFGTPRFLLGKPIENRATAYAELEAYRDGVIQEIQRYFKREIERQWYDPLTRKILAIPETEDLTVHVKHVWKPVRTQDVYAMAAAVAQLYNQGLGLIGDFPEKGWEMMGWDPEELEKKLEEMEQMEPTDIQRQVEEMTTMKEQLQSMLDRTKVKDAEIQRLRADTDRIVKKIDERIAKILEE